MDECMDWHVHTNKVILKTQRNVQMIYKSKNFLSNHACPFCDELIFYTASITTHVTHTHPDRSVELGINDGSVMGKNNIEQHAEQTRQTLTNTRNDHDTPSADLTNIKQTSNVVPTKNTPNIHVNSETTVQLDLNRAQKREPDDKKSPVDASYHHKRRPKPRGRHQ